MSMPNTASWKVSLHGGHSGPYCDHATGTLEEVLEAAVAYGYQTFGVSEHAPRLGDHLLYEDERAMGWTVATLEEKFAAYARDVRKLAKAYADRLVVLCGFEAEVVPGDRYVEIMLGLRDTYGFDYMVGSVHHIREILIDGPGKDYERAVETVGGIEALGVAYYEAVAEMVRSLRPEVVSHLDLVRKNAPDNEAVETPAIRHAALAALDVIGEFGCILDLNTAGYRKGLGAPYPRPWLLREALERGIPFCFGDDSHGPAQVGKDVDRARGYLVENGADTITFLTREAGAIVRRKAPLSTA